MRTQQTTYLCRVIVLSHYDFFNIQSRIVSFPQVDEPAKKYKDNCGGFLSGEVNLAHNSPTECIWSKDLQTFWKKFPGQRSKSHQTSLKILVCTICFVWVIPHIKSVLGYRVFNDREPHFYVKCEGQAYKKNDNENTAGNGQLTWIKVLCQICKSFF